MRYTENGFDLTIDFEHTPPSGLADFDEFIPRKTICAISMPGVTIGSGEAICGNRDNFRRAMGRKVSLARALRAVGYDREMRTNIWKWYLTKVRKA